MEKEVFNPPKLINSVIDKMQPYINMTYGELNYIWFNEGVLYVTLQRTYFDEYIPASNDKYQESLTNLLKEEYDFIKEVVFI